jgi:hypothetical protein
MFTGDLPFAKGGGVMVDVVHDTPNQQCAGVKSIYSIKQA